MALPPVCAIIAPVRALAVTAPAKLNLHLQVLGKRPDGFHEVRTLLQSLDLADELVAESAPAGTLELKVEPAGSVGAGPDNLVLRAARSLLAAAGSTAGARLTLRKQIPVGGGLGGGSADAAAALVLLDQLWELDRSPAELLRLAAGLGSDVPFFLVSGLALGVGRGEELIPLGDLPELGVVVLAPAVEVPTAAVYGRIESGLTWNAPDPNLTPFTAGLGRFPAWHDLYNDLEPVVVEGWPQVAAALDQLRGVGAYRAAVTGSGAAVYAVFESPAAAKNAAKTLVGSWRLHVGRILTREAARLTVRTVG